MRILWGSWGRNQIITMTLQKKLLFIAFMILVGCSEKQTSEKENNTQEIFFNEVNSENSGINFSNDLYPKGDLNIIEYLYYYNGGGVALGDINNDGYLDIVAACELAHIIYFENPIVNVKTQKWQLEYFFEVNDFLDKERIDLDAILNAPTFHKNEFTPKGTSGELTLPIKKNIAKKNKVALGFNKLVKKPLLKACVGDNVFLFDLYFCLSSSKPLDFKALIPIYNK